MSGQLTVGDLAPSFRGRTVGGRDVRLEDYRGRKLIVYFYPKDDTPGCRAQACSFRDEIQAIRARGAEVIGISTQNVASHERFTNKYQLGFPLVADPKKEIAKSFGAMGGAGFQGLISRLFGLARRVTFILDEEGRITHIVDPAQTTGAASEILALL